MLTLLDRLRIATVGRQSSPELQIIIATKEIIEAEYSTLMGDRILIVSEVSPRGDAVRVSIKSTSGETIFEVRHLFALVTLTYEATYL